MANYMIAKFDRIDAIRCPCGFSKRAFVDPNNDKATMHIVDIQTDSQTHYHKKLTEIYFVLEGEGEIELDGEKMVIEPLTAVLIKPCCRHRARPLRGKMRIVNVCIPPFDPEDEWFD